MVKSSRLVKFSVLCYVIVRPVNCSFYAAKLPVVLGGVPNLCTK